MKNGQNTDLNNQNVQFWGTPKKPEKGQERTYQRKALTFMYKSIEI